MLLVSWIERVVFCLQRIAELKVPRSLSPIAFTQRHPFCFALEPRGHCELVFAEGEGLCGDELSAYGLPVVSGTLVVKTPFLPRVASARVSEISGLGLWAGFWPLSRPVDRRAAPLTNNLPN